MFEAGAEFSYKVCEYILLDSGCSGDYRMAAKYTEYTGGFGKFPAMVRAGVN
ncbi:MAG: hypothetical protein HFH48_03445 [Lachnospiraceae bacterium]|nr:hypothetical protein [Lachnospiraceae bacterium]